MFVQKEGSVKQDAAINLSKNKYRISLTGEDEFVFDFDPLGPLEVEPATPLVLFTPLLLLLVEAVIPLALPFGPLGPLVLDKPTR